MTVKGIVFDLDGTLVDSLSATFEAFNYGILQQGGRKHTSHELMSYFGPGETEIFAKILGHEKADAAYRASRDYMDAHLGEIPLHPGIGELLKQLQENQIPASIFTGRSWTTTEMILKHHGLLNYFVTVVASDHVTFPKPAPEGLLLALARMNLQPQEVLFVGDSPTDLMASRAAGSVSVAALWDLMAKRSELEPYRPNYWAEHPRQVWELLLKV